MDKLEDGTLSILENVASKAPAEKLKERLLARISGETEHGTAWQLLINPDGPEAADEITRLNAEVEEAKAGRDQYADLYGRRCGDLLKAQCELAAANTLIDEMVEGLEGAKFKLGRYRSDHPETYIGGVAAEYDATIRSIEALILKARGKDANVG